MSISRAAYVSCDDCGQPAEVVVVATHYSTLADEARSVARGEGFTRKNWCGRVLDLCRTCTLARERGNR